MKTLLLVFSILVLSFALSQTAISQLVLTVEPAEPDVGNCFPFGNGGSVGWVPFMGFIYQNVPPFQLQSGDTLAFDLGAVNSADVMIQIEMASTTVNGGTIPELPFTTLVTNDQTPLNPNGDTVIGNFEMMFTVGAPFSFPGGGLIIRFSNPSLEYQQNTECDQVLVRADSTDSSGNFVIRFFGDSDGLPPYDDDGETNIGGFRIINDRVNIVPTLSEWGLIAMAGVLGIVGFMVMRRRKVTA